LITLIFSEKWGIDGVDVFTLAEPKTRTKPKNDFITETENTVYNGLSPCIITQELAEILEVVFI
jgi:hypothetical protein